MPSSASATSSSNRSTDTSITSPLSQAFVRVGTDGERRPARGPQRRAARRPSPPMPRRSPSSPGRGRARRVCSRVESPTDVSIARRMPATCSRSRSPAKRPVSCAGRLRQLGLRDHLAAGTFHALAYAQLRGLVGRPRHAAARAARAQGSVCSVACSAAAPRCKPSTSPARSSGPRRAWSLPTPTPTPRYAPARRPPLEPARMADLYRRYEEEKRRQRQVDFDDLLWLCVRAIETDNDFAAAQRWRFRHLFVDEFQDVNPLQFRLLNAWRGDRSDLCVVGDPHQAIYSWNGADPRLLRELDKLVPGTSTVALEQNYRSSPQVIATANRVLDSGAVAGLRLRATRPDGPVPTIRSMADDRSEARGVARAVLDRHRPGVPWSHQAVLVRTNAQTVLIAEACRAVGVPVRVRGQRPFLELPGGPRGAPRDAAQPGAARRAARRARRAAVGVGRPGGVVVRRRARSRCATSKSSCASPPSTRPKTGRRTWPGSWPGCRPPSVATRPAGVAMPSISPRSTPPRASSGRSCTSPASKTVSSRSATPARRKR